MEDVLMLRDWVWALRALGHACIYLDFISALPPRFATRRAEALGAAGMAAVALLVQRTASATLWQDVLANAACWALACLLLKKTDWRNAVYGALSFAVLWDMTKIVAHDMLFGLLLDAYLTAVGDTARGLLYTALSLSIEWVLARVFRRWIFASDKRLFSPMQSVLLLAPAALYFFARNFQFVIVQLELTDGKTSLLLYTYCLSLMIGGSDLMIAILADGNLSTRLQQEELHHMQAVMQKQHQEFLAQKAATDAVNQKYHDLKNCLLSLQAQKTAGEGESARGQVMAALDEVLRPLEASVETGNEFLNVTISEKCKLCQQRGIRLTPFVDGHGLDFIEGLDLCVIVGNALDNAIEAVEKLPEEKREIHLKICCAQGTALFTVQNEYSGALKPDAAGLFKTEKPDAANHGYGLRGIRQLAEKYEGTLTVNTAGQQFVLTILLPLPEGSAAQNGAQKGSQ
jgi:hypothetical protein